MKKTIFLATLALLMIGCKNKVVESLDVDTLGYVATDNVDSILTTPWMDAYSNYLKTDSLPCDLTSYRLWGLAYIDDDEIPEMVFRGNCEACGKTILTQHNGRVSQWSSWRNGVECAPREGLIRNNDGSMGHYYDRYFRLEKGVFTEHMVHHEKYEEFPYKSFTTLGTDTVDIEVYAREEQHFESLPHIDLDAIQSYPMEVLLKQLINE